MTANYNYSKILHWATLCCFLFPFFYTGCGPSGEEKAAAEKYKQDSIAAVDAAKVPTTKQDSLNIKNIDTIENEISQVDTLQKQMQSFPADTTASQTKKDQFLSEAISNKFTFLRQVLIPKADTYTGIATVIDSIPYISFFAVFVSFLFLIISLTVKFIETSARKTVLLLDIVALIFLYISQRFAWEDSKSLWGFWVCIVFLFVLTIYDLYVLNLDKRRPESE